MIHKAKDKKWNTHDGDKVPVQYIGDYEKKKERVLATCLTKANSVSKTLKELKSLMFSKADDLYAEMLEIKNIDAVKRKGNYTIFSFDKSVKLEITISNRLEFDDRINLAQEKLNEFIALKTEGIDHDITELINNAFKTTKGKLDSKRIISLFSLKITHPIWNEAMELIKESMSTNHSARYVTISVKDENTGKYEQIQLNFSAI